MADDIAKSPKAIESAIALWIARIILPGIISICLAILAWVVNRGVDTVDKIDKKVEHVSKQQSTLDTSVQLLKQQVESSNLSHDGQMQNINRLVADHEVRIRSVEQRGPR